MLPDVLLIDGGKGQLAQASAVLADLGVTRRDAGRRRQGRGTPRRATRRWSCRTAANCAPARNRPRCSWSSRSATRRTASPSPATAAAARKLRATSRLEDIPGIGPRRRASLLKHFGGLAGLKQAGAEEIARVEGINAALAERIYATLHGLADARRGDARTEAGRDVKMTVPTMLTLLRIVLIPVLVVVFYLPYKWTNFAAAFVFAFASLTDWLDGWIARRYDQYSAFGAFLDPVADKLMVATALFLIVQSHPTRWMALWAAVIVGREITMSALREWMAEIGQRAKVAVASVGKFKTIVQMVAMSCCCTRSRCSGLPVFTIGEWLLAAAALLTLWSGYEYLRAAWPALQANKPHVGC